VPKFSTSKYVFLKGSERNLLELSYIHHIVKGFYFHGTYLCSRHEIHKKGSYLEKLPLREVRFPEKIKIIPKFPSLPKINFF